MRITKLNTQWHLRFQSKNIINKTIKDPSILEIYPKQINLVFQVLKVDIDHSCCYAQDCHVHSIPMNKENYLF